MESEVGGRKWVGSFSCENDKYYPCFCGNPFRENRFFRGIGFLTISLKYYKKSFVFKTVYECWLMHVSKKWTFYNFGGKLVLF